MNDLATGDVHDVATRLHHGEQFIVEHGVGFVGQRKTYRNHV